ncbi:hypothetical protein [Parafrankia sp. FMc2]|uniref:hypothetical protein n=1 Tax=Parafrankia sp. FMc2 TaxID=3233196 RepID=UPI0034D65404
MSVRDTVSPDFLTRFQLGAWHELIRTAVVEWAPDQTTNLYGSGFDGTEIEFLDGVPVEDIREFLVFGIGDLFSLACRLGDKAPTPEELGAEYVLSRQRAGAGLWDRGLGPEGDRLHELARSLGDIELQVSGQADDCDSWTVDVL